MASAASIVSEMKARWRDGVDLSGHDPLGRHDHDGTDLPGYLLTGALALELGLCRGARQQAFVLLPAATLAVETNLGGRLVRPLDDGRRLRVRPFERRPRLDDHALPTVSGGVGRGQRRPDRIGLRRS